MSRTLLAPAIAALLVAGCMHDAGNTRYAKRGEPVGVNSVPAANAPSPTAMGTTTAAGSETNR